MKNSSLSELEICKKTSVIHMLPLVATALAYVEAIHVDVLGSTAARAVLMSVTRVSTKGCAVVCGLCYHLKSC